MLHPSRSNKLITKIKAETMAFDSSTNFAAASAVPPVAMRSSIIKTLSFSFIESMASIVAVRILIQNLLNELLLVIYFFLAL